MGRALLPDAARYGILRATTIKAGNARMRRLPWYSAILYLFGGLFGLYALGTTLSAFGYVFDRLSSASHAYPGSFSAIGYIVAESGAGVWIVRALTLVSLGRVLQLLETRGDDEYYEEYEADDEEQTTEDTDDSGQNGGKS